jgi:transmembrane sensor
VLAPGERATLSNGNLMKSYNANPNYQSWKTKVFTFENTPLEEVMEVLNKAYDQNLVLGSENLNNCSITVNFDNEAFDAILQVLTSTLDLRVIESGDKLMLEGDGC